VLNRELKFVVGRLSPIHAILAEGERTASNWSGGSIRTEVPLTRDGPMPGAHSINALANMISDRKKLPERSRLGSP